MIYLYSHLKVYTAIITVWSQPTGACGVWQTTSSWTWRWQTSSWPHSTAFSPSSTWETGMRSFLIWAIFYIHIPDTIGNVSRDWADWHLKVHYSKVSTLHTWHITFIGRRNWHYGEFYCSMNQFISLCSVPSSVFTMLAITLDRRRAIMSPLHPRWTKRHLLTWC